MDSSTQTLSEVLAAAIEDGEILRVRYDAGSQPGAVREIKPLEVCGDRLRARDESARPKWFLLERLSIMSVDAPVSYIVRKTKRRRVDPSAMTRGWRFFVPIEIFADAFDVTAQARKRTNLHTGKTETYPLWTQGEPPEYQFQRGDTFHCPPEAAHGAWGAVEDHYCLQVKAGDGDGVTVAAYAFHFGECVAKKMAIHLRYEAFFALLRAGLDPERWRDL